jgi:hypothetical protein
VDKRCGPAIRTLAATRRALVMLATASMIPMSAHAQGMAGSAPEKEDNITVYAGYRFGGGFTDVTTGKTWELTDGPAYSVAADFGIDRQTQWEFFVSHRNSALKASGFSPVADNIGLGITYYHFGGTYFIEEVGRGVYAVGGLGVTNFSPREAGLNSEARVSLNVGFGYMIPAGEHVAVKLEARGFVTLVNSSGGFFCSGGCVVQIKGDTITQGEAMVGISARF